ncbi:glycoside hydrolase, family 28 domain protein [Burkholderia cepacia]|nr:glycoside hydrolase, family 28 domain protein [Burkholderia cepacia]
MLRRRITRDLPPDVSIPRALNNGTPRVPAVQPISGETISNCDFVTPVASGTPTVTSPADPCVQRERADADERDDRRARRSIRRSSTNGEVM